MVVIRSLRTLSNKKGMRCNKTTSTEMQLLNPNQEQSYSFQRNSEKCLSQNEMHMNYNLDYTFYAIF